MVQNKKIKIVGKVNSKFCQENEISYYSNFDIKQSFGLIYHVQKHLNDFVSVESFNFTLFNISTIIKNPYYMHYDAVKNSIKYYKKLKEYVCVVVNLKNNEAFVSTIYPVSKKTIDKLKDKDK